MKLSALNSAIRNLDGAPRMRTTMPWGPMVIHLQKTPLLAALAEQFTRNDETGIRLREDGHLEREPDDCSSTDA